jgi:hypothetical protein
MTKPHDYRLKRSAIVMEPESLEGELVLRYGCLPARSSLITAANWA